MGVRCQRPVAPRHARSRTRWQAQTCAFGVLRYAGKGSKTRSRASAGMPGPLSSTEEFDLRADTAHAHGHAPASWRVAQRVVQQLLSSGIEERGVRVHPCGIGRRGGVPCRGRVAAGGPTRPATRCMQRSGRRVKQVQGQRRIAVRTAASSSSLLVTATRRRLLAAISNHIASMSARARLPMRASCGVAWHSRSARPAAPAACAGGARVGHEAPLGFGSARAAAARSLMVSARPQLGVQGASSTAKSRCSGSFCASWRDRRRQAQPPKSGQGRQHDGQKQRHPQDPMARQPQRRSSGSRCAWL